MKKLLPKISIVLAGLIMVVAFTLPQQANAGWIGVAACILNGGNPTLCATNDFILNVAAEIGQLILQASAFFLSVVSIILNISIILTMNIKALYQATPAIDQTWLIIRNLSSIFIMFALLYTSIQTILDVGKANVKDMVGKIIMVGLLINFSLFFTKTAIDASNLISLQFYRAIVPGSENANINVINGNTSPITNLLTGSFGAGGLSDVFMYNLKITKIYNGQANKNGILTEANGGAYFKILVSTIAGSALMIMAAGSFLAAAVAFIVRIVILLLLLAFSPVYFVGMIFPQIEQAVSKKWEGWLIAELTFMPVYLLFMYVALSFISTINPDKSNTGFMGAIDMATNGSQASSSGGIMLYMVGILLQYAIAFILISVPLMAAAKTGGVSMEWGQSAKKWVSGKLKAGSKETASFAMRHTVGKLASAADKHLADTPLGNSMTGRFVRSLTTEKAAKSKYGGSSSIKDYEKEKKEVDKKAREINKVAALNLALSNPSAIDHKKIRDTLDSMSSSEIAGLGKKILTNEHIIPNLSSADYASIEKSDKKDEDKVAIRMARNEKLTNAVTGNKVGDIKAIMKNMSGSDLQKYLEDTMLSPSSPPKIPSDTLIEHIRATQLKDMDSMDANLRKIIGTGIRDWGTNPSRFGAAHPAEGFVNNNSNTSIWT